MGTSLGFPSLDHEVQALIGEKLRLYYADLLTEPVPERFCTLIERLVRSEGGRS